MGKRKRVRTDCDVHMLRIGKVTQVVKPVPRFAMATQLMYDQRPDEELQKKMIERKPCTTIVEVVPQVPGFASSSNPKNASVACLLSIPERATSNLIF